MVLGEHHMGHGVGPSRCVVPRRSGVDEYQALVRPELCQASISCRHLLFRGESGQGRHGIEGGIDQRIQRACIIVTQAGSLRHRLPPRAFYPVNDMVDIGVEKLLASRHQPDIRIRVVSHQGHPFLMRADREGSTRPKCSSARCRAFSSMALSG